MCGARPPVLGADRHPDARRDGVGETVKGQRGDKADDALRHELGCLGERMVGVERGVGELIEAAAELEDKDTNIRTFRRMPPLRPENASA
jgi:hypothetical protein